MTRAAVLATNSDAAELALSPHAHGLVRAAIATILTERGPSTDDEILRAYAERTAHPSIPKVTPQRLRSERARLVREGLVREADVIAFSDLGNRAAAWATS